MHANQAQVEVQSPHSHPADHSHFADAEAAADAARRSAHFDLRNLAVLGSLGWKPGGIDQEWSYAESHMGYIHQAGLDKMESIGVWEEEDSAAVDPDLDIHHSLGLEPERYRKELDDHKLGY